MRKSLQLILMILGLFAALNGFAYGTAAGSGVEIKVGETLALKPFLIAEGALKEGKPEWKSLSPEVASVSSEGLILGLKPGKALVMARINYGSSIKEARVEVTVKSLVSAVTLSESKLTLAVGQNGKLSAVITPAAGVVKPILDGVYWKTQNDKIAVIDAQGVITGISPGKVILYASSKDGDVRAYCDVEVVSMVKSVSLAQTSINLDMGQTYQIDPVVLPESAIFKKVVYKSQNPTVAAVDEKGYVVAKAVGTTQILATSVDGAKTAAMTVTVQSLLTGIQLDKTYLELDNVNKSYQLTPIFLLKDPGKPAVERGIKWSSSSPAIVSVDSSGLVKALKPGLVTITAMSADGGFLTYCTVKSTAQVAPTIEIPVQRIEILDPPKLMYTGEEVELAYKIYPENATNRSVSFRADRALGSQTINSSGKVKMTPTSAGFYQITATAGEATEVFYVEVRQSVRQAVVTAEALDAVSGGYALYLGQSFTAGLVVDLEGIDKSRFTNPKIVWSGSSGDLKIEPDASGFSAKVTLLKPTNAYLEASLLEGAVKKRIYLIYEPMGKALEAAENAQINLSYRFMPEVKLSPKDGLRYGYKQVIDPSVKLYAEALYVATAFLKDEIAYEAENLPSFKARADEAATPALQEALLKEWAQHVLRKSVFEQWLTEPDAAYQKIEDSALLTDRSLKKLSFFEITKEGVSSSIEGKALIRLVSNDGNLEKQIWVTAKHQQEDLILMDQAGKVIATSSEIAKQKLLEKEAAQRAAEEAAAKAPVSRLEAAKQLVLAYEQLTGKKTKAIPTQYYTDTKDGNVSKAYSLGILGSLGNRKFEPSKALTTAEASAWMLRTLKAAKVNAKGSTGKAIEAWGKAGKGNVTSGQFDEKLKLLLGEK